MRKKINLLQKISLLWSLLLVAVIPVSTYFVLTQSFDIRNFAYSTSFETSTDVEESRVEFTPGDTSGDKVTAKAEFQNTTNEAVVKLAYKLVVDEKYLTFDPASSSDVLAEPVVSAEDGTIKTYSWDNILKTCPTYPCGSSLMPGENLSLDIALTPVSNTSNLPDGKTSVYSVFSDVTSTENLKVPENIATLPTTGDDELTSKTDLLIAEAGVNQSPVCDLLDINGPMNPSALLINRPISFITRGKDSDNGIKQVKVEINKVTDGGTSTLVKLLTWEFSNQKEVTLKGEQQSPAFSYTFTEKASYNVNASFTDRDGKTGSCAGSESLSLKVVDSNSAPEFTTDPEPDKTASTPINQGTPYSYIAKATDKDKDGIDYQVVAKPDWLAFAVNKDLAGILDGTFRGTPTNDKHAGTHPIVYSVTDGYSGHITSQIWVLRVNKRQNDTPQVVVDLPIRSALANNKDTVIAWRASDENNIKEFDVYLAENPLDRTTWEVIKENLNESQRQITWKTPATAKGNFYIIVEATDNSTDELRGFGISDIFSIGTGVIPPRDGKDYDIEAFFPIISNVTPKEGSKITDTKPVISADIKASKDATLVASKVSIELDDSDISSQVEVRGNGNPTGSLLLNLDNALTKGVHKVTITIEDSNAQKSTKSWEFTIKDPVTVKEPEKPDERVIDIFGYKIVVNNNLLIAGIIILIVILLALLLPWVIFFVQSRAPESTQYSDYNTYAEYQTTEPTPPTTSTSTTETTTNTVTEEPVYTPYVETQTTTEVTPTPTEQQAMNYVPIGPDFYQPTDTSTTTTTITESSPEVAEPPVTETITTTATTTENTVTPDTTAQPEPVVLSEDIPSASDVRLDQPAVIPVEEATTTTTTTTTETASGIPAKTSIDDTSLNHFDKTEESNKPEAPVPGM